MGVGVYESDFNNTGGTFLVSGPLATQEDYVQYRKELELENPDIQLVQAADGDWNFRIKNGPEPQAGDTFFATGMHGSRDDAFSAACEKTDVSLFDYDGWARDEYDDFNEQMIDTLEEAGAELGMTVENRRGFNADRATFDTEFVGILGSRIIGVGWCSWEQDFVIGAGATKNNDWQDYLGDPESFTDEILRETGLSPAVFSERYEGVVNAIQEYMRIALLENKIECRFRTSGYTTGTYPAPERPEAEKARLKEVIVAGLATLELSPGDALEGALPADRASMIKALSEGAGADDYQLVAPVFNHLQGAIHWVNPADGEVHASSSAQEGLTGSGVNMAELMRDADQTEGFSPIPRNEQTEAWFQYRQRVTNIALQDLLLVAVSAEEFATVTGQAFSIRYDNDSFKANVEAALILGFQITVGVSCDAAKKSELQETCKGLCAQLQGLSDPRTRALRAGLEAAEQAGGLALSESEMGQLGEALGRAMEVPDESTTVITLIPKKRPGMRM